MLKSILARIAPILILPILIGCGGGGGGIPNPGLSNVVVDMGRSKAALITPDGGKIITADSKGFVYTLTFPQGAVLQDTKVFVYPVTSMKNLPAGGTVTAGVHLAPEGLEFYAPVKLATQVPAGTDPNLLESFAYKGDGSELNLDIGFVNGQTITQTVYHFSGKVLGNRTLAGLVDTTVGGAIAAMRAAMDSAKLTNRQAGTNPTNDYLTILRDFYHRVVEPDLTAASQSGSQPVDILHASQEYDAWLDAILFAQLTIPDPNFNVSPENAQSEPVAVALLKRWYQFGNNACTAHKTNGLSGNASVFDSPLFDARFALMARDRANDWHLPLQANGLDSQTLLNNLCAKVVIEQKQFTTPISPGNSGTLNVKAGISYAGDPPRHDAPVLVTLTRNGNPIGTPQSGQTNQQGDFSSNIAWPQGVDPLTILIKANIDSTGLADVIATDTISKSTNTQGQVTSVRINPSSATVGIGKSATLAATALDANGNPVVVDPTRWQWSASSAIISLAPLGATATVTGISKGSATASVSLAGTTFSASSNITVNSAPFAFFQRTVWFHAVPRCAGTTMIVTNDANNQTFDVAITASAGTISDVSQVTGQGTVFTFHAPDTVGPVTLTATSNADPTVQATFNVDVDPIVGDYTGTSIGTEIVRLDDTFGGQGQSDKYRVRMGDGIGNFFGPTFIGPASGTSFTNTNAVGDSINFTITFDTGSGAYLLSGTFNRTGQPPSSLRALRFCR